MLVFDEKDYAEKIVSNRHYETIKSQGKERCILVRYFTNLGYTDLQIKDELRKIPMMGGEFLSDRDKDFIFDKIIKKANEYEYVTGKIVIIYQSELDIIDALEDEKMREILFVYLVYYKWASQVKHLQFYSKKNEVMMVLENNIDVWKLSGVFNLRVAHRYEYLNKLFDLGLYKVDNFKSHNYIYIPFVVNEGEKKIVISDYKNILGEYQLYKYPDKYKRCCVCGTVITKTRSPKKYCSSCAKKENIRKTQENKRRLKSQSEKTPLKPQENKSL